MYYVEHQNKHLVGHQAVTKVVRVAPAGCIDTKIHNIVFKIKSILTQWHPVCSQNNNENEGDI